MPTGEAFWAGQGGAARTEQEIAPQLGSALNNRVPLCEVLTELTQRPSKVVLSLLSADPSCCAFTSLG